ncbi:MBL fold metallo-hydrolase [Cochlodiniinecator piscidefendens]|uniref:MBL fold metallo-hydrolase n=1 Tax=Cochlodiniinecator piscidefendens TaxID=2715756 RepID=UPI00140CFA2E|nr:MBL fold metallo-hydrolase [Cochlodiniinecator piscidefendens]
MSIKETPPSAGILDNLAPGIARVLAPNPSPMTYWGTNTYIVGEGSVAIIDPGPADMAHLHALLAATRGRRVEAILVTHSHLDHSPLAAHLSHETGAPVMAYGDSSAGMSSEMKNLRDSGLVSGGEGVDANFKPDICLFDGEEVHGHGWTLQALWTPGHLSNHLCFALDDILFTGDHVMGWASSLVSPPDGDLTQFMASCQRLSLRNDSVYFPGHGAPINAPNERINWLISHRLGREEQILNQLRKAAATTETLTRAIYTDINPALMKAAARNVFAHLLDLTHRGLVSSDGSLSLQATFCLTHREIT